MASFEEVKYIDSLSKDTINGYLRRIQSLLPSHNIYYRNIPSLVCHWCLLYFYIKECFDVTKSEKNCSFTKDNTVVTKDNITLRGTIFLMNVVRKGIHKWKFKLIKVQRYALTIGVWKGEQTDNTGSISTDEFSKGKAYGFMVNHQLLIPGDAPSRKRHWTYTTCKSGDVVEMILDLNKRQLSYSVNNESLGIAYNDIQQTCYRAALGIWNKKDCVELISYSSDYKNVTDDN